MKESPSTKPGVCPVCATKVDGKLAGIWTGIDLASGRGCGGRGYEAVCTQCGAELEASPTDEQAKAGLFYWAVREARVHIKQHREKEAQQEAILTPLLEGHAKREQVMGNLGLKFSDYSSGSSDHPELQKWLFLDEVREAAACYPGILFHMDATTMTWLFFDVEQRLQGFLIRTA